MDSRVKHENDGIGVRAPFPSTTIRVSGCFFYPPAHGESIEPFERGVDKLLKPARVPPVLQSVQVALGSACTWAKTSVRNKSDTSI